MAILQTRIFVPNTEGDDWAETLVGRVIRQITGEFPWSVRWLWFSRYVFAIGAQGEDRGDCEFELIPEMFKLSRPGTNLPIHRSLRLRFEIDNADRAAFDMRLRQLITHDGYAISDVRNYDHVGDLGSQRFLGVENRLPGRDRQRAELVTRMYHSVAQLVVDALVGPTQRVGFESRITIITKIRIDRRSSPCITSSAT